MGKIRCPSVFTCRLPRLEEFLDEKYAAHTALYGRIQALHPSSITGTKTSEKSFKAAKCFKQQLHPFSWNIQEIKLIFYCKIQIKSNN